MTASTASQDPSEIGRWELLPYDSQIEAIHMALLHTGTEICLTYRRGWCA